MITEQDLFERVQSRVGCLYISDLPWHRDRIRIILSQISVSDYSKKEWEDFSQYVFGIPFEQLKKSEGW